MTPREYEEAVGEHFRRLGYSAELTPQTNDYGVDAFASRAGERLAIQAKMYGTGRRINREMVMQLHGAKDYFDCTGAVIVTDGSVSPDAEQVARKLRIRIEYFKATVPPTTPTVQPMPTAQGFFEEVWQRHVVPLIGATLTASDGRINKVVNADWTGLTRITSSGKEQFIPIEVFRRAVACIVDHGEVTRDEINENFAKRASSGIVLILSQVPAFEHRSGPSRLVMRPSQNQSRAT